jgi:uncharacterized phiE125 gp8 family phage protein
MMLIEQTTVPPTALPVDEFKEHLRFGTGFADDAIQDAVLESYLRSAMAAIEARTGKIMISRRFLWSLTAWRALAEQAFPVAPVSTIVSLKTLDRQDVVTVIDPSAYKLRKDDHRPWILAFGGGLPVIPIGGSAEVVFEAGYGADWGDLPADLGHAGMLLAAHYYEHRHIGTPRQEGMPYGVTTLIERYRTVRILGGAPA